jgi:tetratricopeptide (TPR) repeat protein
MWGIVLLALLSPGPQAAAQAAPHAASVTVEECAHTIEAGRQAYEARDYGEASVRFTRALAACGPNEELLLALAQAQLLGQDVARALDTLERVLTRDPKNVPALKVKAKALYLSAKDPEAEEALRTAATLAPADAEIPYDLGRFYYHQQRFQAAADSFRRAIAIDPGAYKAWDNLGLAAEALGDAPRARRHYLHAISLVHKNHPHYDVVYANFAELLIKAGEYQTAFNLAAEAAERNPRDARNFFLTGKALAQMERYDIAVRWLEQAIALDQDYPAPRYLVAQAYRHLGRADQANEALKAFAAASARAPKVRR